MPTKESTSNTSPTATGEDQTPLASQDRMLDFGPLKYPISKIALWTPRPVAALFFWCMSIFLRIIGRILPQTAIMGRATTSLERTQEEFYAGKSMIGVRWQQIWLLYGRRFTTSLMVKRTLVNTIEHLWSLLSWSTPQHKTASSATADKETEQSQSPDASAKNQPAQKSPPTSSHKGSEATKQAKNNQQPRNGRQSRGTKKSKRGVRR
ncbi:hypothetical protein THASP1DRAFT_28870 [Thamnocephalis sphaerospora]|uniref:Uncharacterized protein n=1 Tax=Thamnocephalis sphaerospora TaxID=78915 RepID=A0A4P9XT82_9FUNG|nr:hypothetical protein THASP1DRAFT_28870 [Thamnocephalis sphaerospora]|eukprot:RKP09346.1 hypothetical protein THASP1DRAFT_28870 [Thamnocephalis sphaerospora]